MSQRPALFNALSIAIPLWFLRKNRKAFLAFSMCAASMTLIMGSRKIWNPDLVAAWDCFALGFFAMAMQPRADRIQKVLMATSGFSLVMAGHMYLPGGVFALIVTGVASLWLFIYERRSIFYSWLTGCALGWLTFLPYFIAFLNTPHTPHLAQAYTLGQLWPVLRMDALLPSPFGTYELYLKPIHQWMHANAPGLNYYLTLGWTILAMLVWVPLYWISLIRGARNWRSLLKEPLAVCSAAVLLGIPIALYAVRLGSFLHYWLGAFPFAYYFIAWAVCLQPESRNSMKLYRVAWAACLISLVASLQIALLIHQMGGLPGEYGPSYSSQTPQQRLR